VRVLQLKLLTLTLVGTLTLFGPGQSDARAHPAAVRWSAPLDLQSRAFTTARCRDVIYRVNGAMYARTYRLRAERLGCVTARAVARRWLREAEGTATLPRPLGFRCRPRAGFTTCTRGASVVRWASRAARATSTAGTRRLRLRRCGTVAIVTEGVSGRARVTARGVSCRFARRTVRRSNETGVRPRGWSCLGSGEGVFCTPGSIAQAARVMNSPALQARRRWVRSRN